MSVYSLIGNDHPHYRQEVRSFGASALTRAGITVLGYNLLRGAITMALNDHSTLSHHPLVVTTTPFGLPATCV